MRRSLGVLSLTPLVFAAALQCMPWAWPIIVLAVAALVIPLAVWAVTLLGSRLRRNMLIVFAALFVLAEVQETSHSPAQRSSRAAG